MSVLFTRSLAMRFISLSILFALSHGVNAQLLSLVETNVVEAQPTGIHHAGDGSDRLFIASKAGRIKIYDDGTELPESFLDIAALVNSSGVERGFHGLAFHPQYAENGFFYVMYTNLSSDSTLARYQVSGDPNVADPASETILLVIDQPDQYHNISQLQFGPDGYLYIGAGDGGFIGDPDNRAQNLSEWLGKILRIDVDGGFPYAIPADNPFVNMAGARPEIWAYGVRNPWRFSFDRLTGNLYMGDVGQWTWEEVNFQPANSPGGENYGWRLTEGRHCYDPPSNCFDQGITLPILEFQHTSGQCAVTGGFVYRGARFPRFQGMYFYADWCTGRIWGARRTGGAWTSTEMLDSTISPNTFGEDEAGELYIGDDGSGRIFELIDPQPFCDLALSQSSYAAGETITASVSRIANYGQTSRAVRYRLALLRPAGASIVFADSALQVPADTDIDRGPLSLLTVGAQTPPGTYSLNCRLNDPQSGALIGADRAVFEIM